LKRIYFSGSDIPQLIKKTKDGHEVAMDDFVPARYINLFFSDIGIFTPEVGAAELADLFQ
jgi:translation initiation factor 2B subunit (eIF-2B alpha/beta/delta family)